MSRSYKKTPGWTQSSSCNYSRFMKRYANRRFRKYKGDVQNGNWHKKYLDPWTICDYKFLYYSRNEVLREIEEANLNNRWCHPLYRYYMK